MRTVGLLFNFLIAFMADHEVTLSVTYSIRQDAVETARSRGKFHGSFTMKLKYTFEFGHTWEELCMIHLNKM